MIRQRYYDIGQHGPNARSVAFGPAGNFPRRRQSYGGSKDRGVAVKPDYSSFPAKREGAIASTFQPKRHWTIVDEGYLHIGTEYAALYLGMLGPRRLHEGIEQPAALLRGCRRRKARSQPVVRIGRQGELWHDEQISSDLLQT